MRKAAERELTEECGKDMRVYFWGNQPSGWYEYMYPDEAAKHYKAKKAKVRIRSSLMTRFSFTNQFICRGI